MLTLPSFDTARERSFWVQAQLRLAGTSFAAIARTKGWSRAAVANAMLVPSDPQERAIADALGISQQELFPERYDAAGKRLHLVRGLPPRGGAANVKRSEAA